MAHYVTLMRWTTQGYAGLPKWRERIEEGERIIAEAGGKIVQETRLYDPDRNETRSMRSKEDAHDYRYFPDPDLLPLVLDDAFLAECRASLPELPDAKRARYEALGITAYQATVLTAEVEAARWFDALLDAGAKPAAAAESTKSR